jgi:hypothetical protein
MLTQQFHQQKRSPPQTTKHVSNADILMKMFATLFVSPFQRHQRLVMVAVPQDNTVVLIIRLITAMMTANSQAPAAVRVKNP